MIVAVRILVPVYNATQQALSLQAKMDKENSRACLIAGPPAAGNVLEPEKHQILSYTFTDPQNRELKLLIQLTTEGLEKELHLGAVRPEKVQSAVVVLFDENDHAFAFPHDLGAIVITENPRLGQEIQFNIAVAPNLLKGFISCAGGGNEVG